MSTRAEFFQSMYPGLSDGEVIDELIKASIYVFEHGPEVVTISAAEGIHYVPYDAAMQKKSPYWEGTYEACNIPFTDGGEPVEEVEQPVLTSTTDEENVVTVTDEETGALTPEGNLTLVDDYHTDYSDGSGQQFITLVSKSGATFYLVIDRNAKGQQTVHFMNLVDEADLLALMEEDAADAYTSEKEAAAQAEQDRLKAEEEAKKAAEEAAASGSEQPKGNKITKYTLRTNRRSASATASIM